MLRHFETGDTLFRQGDPSDFAVLIVAGSADVLRHAGDDAIVLGQIHAGEFVGEMGVLDGQPRSATVRAASAVDAELIERQAFLDRVSGDPDLARKLLVGMSARLRDADAILTGLYASKGDTEATHGDLVPAPSRLEATPWVTLAASTAVARSLVGAVPIPIIQLPFTVGREPGGHDAPAAIRPDLAIRESAPHRLSRAHFSLIVRDSEVLVRDLNSWLGTIVNDQPLGRNFPRDSAPLHKGENTLIAGGKGSPFVFTLTLA
jgi:CRP/FNR family transcriptional regulator, cyclic AMP receptor protein